jgi:glycosyltransferase involved in cell wall biosynthesis
VHVHSTEFDRTGGHIDRNIYEIERRGVHGAFRVIAVSRYTASILEKHYALDSHQIDVVYNGVELPSTEPSNDSVPSVVALAPSIDATLEKADKVVLFLGRITLQKGPGYFLDVAEQILRRDKKVKFLIAGDGDRMQEIIESAAQRGLGGRVLFAGFLQGGDVERAFKMADVFVMPSVSEPFGLAALEAAAYGVPVVVSKNAGVAEVLQNVIRVDAWDVHGIAERILALLQSPSLKKKLVSGAGIEAKALTWDTAAAGCLRSYRAAIAMMPK